MEFGGLERCADLEGQSRFVVHLPPPMTIFLDDYYVSLYGN